MRHILRCLAVVWLAASEIKSAPAPVQTAEIKSAPAPVAEIKSAPAPAPVAEIKSAPAPVAEIKSAPAPVAEIKSAPAPVAEIKSAPAPVAEIKSAPAPVAEIKSAPAPVAEIKSAPAPVAEIKSAPAPVAEIKSAPAPVAEIKSAQAPVAEIKSAPAPVKTAARKTKPAGSGPSYLNQPIKNSIFTFYGASGRGACGLDVSPCSAAGSGDLFNPSAQWGPSTLPDKRYILNDPICKNICIKVEYNGKTGVFPVDNKCPECHKNHVDLSEAAFLKLEPKGGIVGIARNATLTYISCNSAKITKC